MGSWDFASIVDCPIECCQEKIVNNGEDSYFFSLNNMAGIVGVFDGCGGSGAKKYPKFRGKTGAYMASRVVAGAAKDWFHDFCKAGCKDDAPGASIKGKIKEYLSICNQVGGGTSALKGMISKDFPTTAAIIVSYLTKSGIKTLCLWAGDSRCYQLSEDGLVQLTEDDLGGIDAMENLTTDGVLTNVITTSKDFTIHEKEVVFDKPCILFSATDGCFGYLSTPMEFEYFLIDTLLHAKNVKSWESSLKSILQEIAGDDFSLCGLSIGYGSFQKLQNAYTRRANYLSENYISGIENRTSSEKQELWKTYRIRYETYLTKQDPMDDSKVITNEELGSRPVAAYRMNDKVNYQADESKHYDSPQKQIQPRKLKPPTDLD